MSRIGKKPIVIPANVEVKIEGNVIQVKGPKGELQEKIHPQVKVVKQENEIIVSVDSPEDKNQRALWGLFASLIDNMVTGVTAGYEKKLEVIGVGFRVALQGDKLLLNLGFSHQVEYKIPAGVSASVEKNVITLNSPDKQLIGETAAQIRRIKKPEPYQGKGIKYAEEVIKRKAGKAAAKSKA